MSTTQSPASQAPASQDFETALAQLEHLVHQLEDGGLPLEEALKMFEQGIHLTRDCQQRLAQAEQRVQQLMATHEGIQLQNFQKNPQDFRHSQDFSTNSQG